MPLLGGLNHGIFISILNKVFMYLITLLLPRVVVATRVVTSSRPKIDHGSPQNAKQQYLFLKRSFRDLYYILGPGLDCSRCHWMSLVCLILRVGLGYHRQTSNDDNAHVSNGEGGQHTEKHRSASRFGNFDSSSRFLSLMC